MELLRTIAVGRSRLEYFSATEIFRPAPATAAALGVVDAPDVAEKVGDEGDVAADEVEVEEEEDNTPLLLLFEATSLSFPRTVEESCTVFPDETTERDEEEAEDDSLMGRVDTRVTEEISEALSETDAVATVSEIAEVAETAAGTTSFSATAEDGVVDGDVAFGSESTDDGEEGDEKGGEDDDVEEEEIAEAASEAASEEGREDNVEDVESESEDELNENGEGLNGEGGAIFDASVSLFSASFLTIASVFFNCPGGG